MPPHHRLRGAFAGADLAARSPSSRPFTGWSGSPSATDSEPTRGGSLLVCLLLTIQPSPMGKGDRSRKARVDEGCFRLTWASRLRNNRKDRMKILRIFRKDNPLITAYAELLPGRTLPPVLRLPDHSPDGRDRLRRPTPNPPKGEAFWLGCLPTIQPSLGVH
jgi:hypothetical protein